MLGYPRQNLKMLVNGVSNIRMGTASCGTADNAYLSYYLEEPMAKSTNCVASISDISHFKAQLGASAINLEGLGAYISGDRNLYFDVDVSGTPFTPGSSAPYLSSISANAMIMIECRPI